MLTLVFMPCYRICAITNPLEYSGSDPGCTTPVASFPGSTAQLFCRKKNSWAVEPGNEVRTPAGNAGITLDRGTKCTGYQTRRHSQKQTCITEYRQTPVQNQTTSFQDYYLASPLGSPANVSLNFEAQRSQKARNLTTSTLA